MKNKNKKKKDIIVDGIKFDSKEELEFYYWLKEAKKVGYVDQYFYQQPKLVLIPKKSYPVVKVLKTKTKVVNQHLLHPLKYTGDFRIKFTEQFFKDFPHCGLIRLRTLLNDPNKLKHNISTLWINVDVKGEYNIKNQRRMFSMTQKIVYEQTGHFINLIVPEEFFNKTWVPKEAAFTNYKNRRNERRKAYTETKLLSEVLT